MHLDKLADIIKEANPETFETVSGRRNILKSFGAKVAAVALPYMALSAMGNKARAQSTAVLIETLNYGLLLKYMQYEFYKKALEHTDLIPEAELDNFKKIAKSEEGHVAVFKYLINDLGGTVDDSPTFDFSGGYGSGGQGPFADTFTNYLKFLELAMILEDTCVRAYIGLGNSLLPRDTLVYHVSNIQSVDARHAAHIRGIRTVAYGSKPWISQNKTTVDNPNAIPFYAGEQNTIQYGVNVENINGYALNADTVTEAFDEPLTKVQIMELIARFIAP